MKLINITFEEVLQPKQKREFTRLEIKFFRKTNTKSDDEKYTKDIKKKSKGRRIITET